MGRPKLADPRCEYIGVRLLRSEREFVDQAAADNGIGYAEYVRNLIREQIEQQATTA